MLNSINYSHWGQPKMWYCVPDYDREKFEKAVKQKLSLVFEKDPNILLDIVTMVSPTYLASYGVKVYKTLQKPGEFILTLPGSYHAGFSTGINIGEAVNFTTKSWLQYGEKCQNIYRKSKEKIPVFPMDWLLIKNIQHLSRIQLDLETKQKLLFHFENFYKVERKAR
jgi:histone demethylase JARID1